MSAQKVIDFSYSDRRNCRYFIRSPTLPDSSFFSQGPWLLCIYSDLNLSAVGGCLNRLSNTGMSEKIISLLDASTQPSDPARQLRATLQCVWWNSAGRDILRWLVQFFAIIRDLFDEAIKKQSKAIRHSDEDTKAGFFKQLAFVSTISSIQIQKLLWCGLLCVLRYMSFAVTVMARLANDGRSTAKELHDLSMGLTSSSTVKNMKRSLMILFCLPAGTEATLYSGWYWYQHSTLQCTIRYCFFIQGGIVNREWTVRFWWLSLPPLQLECKWNWILRVLRFHITFFSYFLWYGDGKKEVMKMIRSFLTQAWGWFFFSGLFEKSHVLTRRRRRIFSSSRNLACGWQQKIPATLDDLNPRVLEFQYVELCPTGLVTRLRIEP